MPSFRTEACLLLAALAGCGGDSPAPTPRARGSFVVADAAAPAHDAGVTEALRDPVPFYEAGRLARTLESTSEGLLLLDLGDDWTPILFSESDPGGATLPHPYRPTYLALARGEIPDDYHGERAREDRYLELYGIPPTISVLRERLASASESACDLRDLQTIAAFRGTVGYDDPAAAIARARRLARAEETLAGKTLESVAPDDRALLREWITFEPRFRLVEAVQRRLRCEGHLGASARIVRGAFDSPTHEALAAFERRHRIFGWGNLAGETLAALKQPAIELEHQAVIRVLTERAMHQACVIEDGSASELADGRPNTFVDASGAEQPVPDLERALRRRIVESFGLETPATTLAFLRSLEAIGGARVVAVADVPRPEYYGPDMELSVEIDRGDVWYEFPYDERGRERPHGISRKPSLTVFTTYRRRRIPLARYATTVGGWRTEMVEGSPTWAYKESPPGPVVWDKIVSSPVWLPPASTPPRSLLVRGRDGLVPDRHEMGPSYASAYGLVAAYHRPYVRDADGTISTRGDQGIRTHGSVSYMSVARSNSHGCHRLHNHVAVRLMSFVLAHRPYVRRGENTVRFRRAVQVDGRDYTLAVDHGGYEFTLVRPLQVTVTPGRILGPVERPIQGTLPRFDPSVGAYRLPDGGTATVDRNGVVTPLAPPVDAGVPEATDEGDATRADAT